MDIDDMNVQFTSALRVQQVLLHALAATHPDPPRLLNAFEQFADRIHAQFSDDPKASGLFLAAIDATRVALQAQRNF